MTDYVKEYLRLDKRAGDAESKVEKYKKIAEDDRWEQCRLVWEAVESRGWNRKSFAGAVDKSHTVVNRQYNIWKRYRETRVSQRPTYSEAYAESYGALTGQARTQEIAVSGVRNLPVEKKAEVYRELQNDPEVASFNYPDGANDPVTQARYAQARKDAGLTRDRTGELEFDVEAASYIERAKTLASKFIDVAGKLNVEQRKAYESYIDEVIGAWSGVKSMLGADVDEWIRQFEK